jgi:hypothetical protein
MAKMVGKLYLAVRREPFCGAYLHTRTPERRFPPPWSVDES